MSTPQELIANELRAELQSRIRGWKSDREQLSKAAARIAELDELIAYAESQAKQDFSLTEPSTEESPAEESNDERTAD